MVPDAASHLGGSGMGFLRGTCFPWKNPPAPGKPRLHMGGKSALVGGEGLWPCVLGGN